MVLKRIPYLVKLLILIIGSSAFFVVSYDIPPHHLKRMEKVVQKHYKTLDVSLDMNGIFADSSSSDVGYYIPIMVSDSLVSYLCYRETTACNFGGCTDTTCHVDKSNQFKEIIHYFAILKPSNELEKLCILEYESRYGYEITSKWWLKQFYSQPTGSFKLNSNIDGISGATVSVKAMVDDINKLSVN